VKRQQEPTYRGTFEKGVRILGIMLPTETMTFKEAKTHRMADISIQFHAVPDEILALLQPFVVEQRLHVIALRFPPFRAAPAELAESVRDSTVRSLALAIDTPDATATTSGGFRAANPDMLTVQIGRHTQAGLGESWLAARTNDWKALAQWQALAKALKATTFTGVLAVNAKTGATAPARSHRFTAGARALAAEGVIMLASAGSVTYRFPD